MTYNVSSGTLNPTIPYADVSKQAVSITDTASVFVSQVQCFMFVSAYLRSDTFSSGQFFTSSPALAGGCAMLRDFTSVSSFNGTIRRVQVPFQIYDCMQLNSVMFSSLYPGRP